MIFHHQLRDLADLPGPLHLALGVFDGVHLGHQAVLAAALDRAARHGGTAVAVTFHPHPASFFAPDRAPKLIVSIEERLRRIEKAGIDEAIVLSFDADLASREPEDFVRDLTGVNARGLATIAVGMDWTFGKGRRGDVALLRALGAGLGFELCALPLVEIEGRRVSSTAIRQALMAGDVAWAAKLLGASHSITGRVVQGRQLGRRIGFPTANLEPEGGLLPGAGVYAVRVRGGGLPTNGLGGVANVGWRPTVEGESIGEPRLEVHVFDFEGDLYGSDLGVEFLSRLREERKFDGLDALKAQIALDAREARRLTASA